MVLIVVRMIRKECTFLVTMIRRIQGIIATQCATDNDLQGNTSYPVSLIKKTIDDPLSYDTSALQQEVVTLSFEGFIAYLYVKAFGKLYPSNPTADEKIHIAEIYAALNISVPPVING